MKEKKAISKSLGKIVTGCIIGTVAFMGQKIIAEASELPIAGIDLVLCAFYENEGNKGKDVIEYLNSKELSEYKDLGFAQVSYYLNVRSKASEEGKILGKLYNNSAATIISKKGDWFKVKSGSVIGYVKSNFLATGEKAAEIAEKVGTRIATVNTETLKVRKSASLDAIVLSLAPIGEELSVKKEGENWVKISDDNGSAGYVAAEYVDISTEFEDAVSIEEEQERLADEEAARQQNNNSGQITSFSIDSNSGCSSVRNNIADYALKFLGNSYVFGGTSLTNGTDCSGFSQSVFRHFGIYIPRTSRTQAQSGRSVSLSNIQKGDLIFYGKNGTINHVAIYIGNGQVVSASNPRDGIKITNYTYRTPYKVVSYLN
jgi:cell wall-associated NlpC family hydrolase